MSNYNVYEVIELCFTGTTREDAEQNAEAWLSKPVPVLDANGNPEFDAAGNPKLTAKYEVIKYTIKQELVHPDGSVMLIYTIIGQRAEGNVYEYSRSG